MKTNTTSQAKHSVSAGRKAGYYRFIFIPILTILANVAWAQGFGAGIVLSIPTVGKHIRAMATADFNSDGKADIAAISESDHTMEIVLSKSGGGYAPSKIFKVTNGPTAIKTGDFNGDHKPDIIVSLSGSSEVKVFLNANGTFSATNYLDTPTGMYPSGLAVSDFNGDGNLDVVVTEEGNARVRVMLGTGLGDFLSPNFYNVGKQPRSIAVADYNSDGKPDIAVANFESGEISTLINKGILGFYPAVNMNTGRKISKIISADFNGDSYPDLAVANMFASSITVILCNKYGTYVSYTDYPVGNGPTSMSVGDFNNDGKIDLAVGNFFSANVSVMMNTGGGLFGPSKTYQSAYALVWDIMSCDANHDGLTDVLLTTSNNEIKGLRQDEAIKKSSSPADIRPSNPTGIIPARSNSRIAAEEPEQETSFDAIAYPNPVDKELNVDIAGAAGQKVRVILMDVTGRTLKDQVLVPTDNTQRESMDMSQNQMGIYLLQVSTNTKTKTLRVMKR